MSFDKGDVVDAQGHPSAAEQWLPAVIVDKGGAGSATLYFACDGPRHQHDIARGATETPSMAEAAAAAGVLDDEPAVGTSAEVAAEAAVAAAAMPPPPPTRTRR